MSPHSTSLCSSVQNSCPKSTSHIHRYQRVVRRSVHGTPARLCPRLHHRPTAAAPGRRPERAGCWRIFTETASGAHTDRPALAQVLDQLRPATPWSSGNWTASTDRCGTWSTPSVSGLADRGSGSAASRRRPTPPPRRQARLRQHCGLHGCSAPHPELGRWNRIEHRLFSVISVAR
jgi:hypothetical protein